MRRSSLRGSVLRAFTAAVAALLLPALLTATGQPAVAAVDAVPEPPAWVPSATVDREPDGVEEPDRPWTAPRAAPGREQRAAATTPECPGTTSELVDWHRVSDSLEVGVDLVSGELRVVAHDLTVRGTGLDLSVDHVYEGSTYSSTLGGWMLGTGPDIGLATEFQDESGHLELWGANGCSWDFPKRADGGYDRAPGLPASLRKLPGGKYVVTFDRTGETWLFTASGWLVSQADRNGNSITFRYTTRGGLASITDTQGRVTSFTNTPTGMLGADMIQWITDPSGAKFGDFTYGRTAPNSLPYLTGFTDRGGNRIEVGYLPDTSGTISTITDARGGVHRIEHDGARVSTITKPGPDGPLTTTYVDEGWVGSPVTVTDANGHTSRYEFDDQDRPVSVTDALGHRRSTTWTANSDVASTTNALDHQVSYSYDTLNNPTGSSRPTGATSAVGYTSSAHPHLPTLVTDPSGNNLSREYDDAGNLLKVRSDALDVDVATFGYNDPNGTVSYRVDGKGEHTDFTYDTAGNLTEVAPPAPAGATSYTYDSLSRITSVTDGNGVRLDYGYDALDRVTSVKHGATVLQANDYDANGNLTKTQTPTATRTFTHDPRNALVETRKGAETITYQRDAVGNLVALTTPSGTAHYTYDAADRLVELDDAFGGTTTFAYDAADRRTATTFPGGATQTNTYDSSGRLTALRVTSATASELINATWRYSRADGTDTDKVQARTRAGGTTTYRYDALGRLTGANSGTYTYDDAGNLLSGEGHTYQVDAADRFTQVDGSAVGFDAAGNLTSSASPAGTFTYSPANQLIRGTTSGQTTLSLSYDTADQTQPAAITETPPGGSATTHVFTRTALGVSETVDNGARTGYSRDPEGLLLGLRTPTGARYGAVTDHQGSVLGLVDTNGNLAASYVYSPYGAAVTTNGGAIADANPFRWLGGYRLQGGVYALGERFYNPTYARFTAPDPTGQEMNPYAYAQGDPVNLSDPTGTAPNACDVSAFGTAVGWTAAGFLIPGYNVLFTGAAVGVAFTALWVC
ncbi:RHS repeat-associated core domain-containing protein [Saccharothrix longispora]|uniref:RHS repeat-associated core domain-containing protein n=1 Tax=Saccharothrix longispora TaxID=33920 RepID=UPI0028FDB958|nr:RHS repeat-associated core domain-containing protein [Saccharothrix longispora]MDU0288974.1 RHS repeat-associated core domain-containing protein [Saccharothrix longispora]